MNRQQTLDIHQQYFLKTTLQNLLFDSFHLRESGTRLLTFLSISTAKIDFFLLATDSLVYRLTRVRHFHRLKKNQPNK